jgi:predicted transcriptional regulator
MIEHNVQRQILRFLGHHERARFTDIKPPELENNAFQYHLKQLIAAKLIRKNEDGTYEITPEGKQEFIVSHLSRTELHEQAHAIFLCALRDGDKWLVARRKVQPELGLTGFIHGEAVAGEPLLDTATRRFHDKTGLTAVFDVKGAGYIRIFKAGELSSFVHATLLYADSYSGELATEYHTSSHAWMTRGELEKIPLISSMPLLFNILESKASPFFDEMYEI